MWGGGIGCRGLHFSKHKGETGEGMHYFAFCSRLLSSFTLFNGTALFSWIRTGTVEYALFRILC